MNLADVFANACKCGPSELSLLAFKGFGFVMRGHDPNAYGRNLIDLNLSMQLIVTYQSSVAWLGLFSVRLQAGNKWQPGHKPSCNTTKQYTTLCIWRHSRQCSRILINIWSALPHLTVWSKFCGPGAPLNQPRHNTKGLQTVRAVKRVTIWTSNAPQSVIMSDLCHIK